MGFFTQREHGQLDRPTVIEAKFREVAGRNNSPGRVPAHDARRPDEPPQNYAPRWRAEKDRVDGKAERMLEQMTADAIKQIDWLLIELQAHRQRLLSEAARVQQDLVDYATLSQSTMQSTKIITESLTYWNRPNAPGNGETKEHDRTSAAAFVQPGEDSGLTAAQPETPVGTDSASGETPEVSNSPTRPDHIVPESDRAT